MITVFGSINVDLVLKTEHLPAPGETVLCPNYEMVAGGKGANQALAAARSGAVVRMVGCVGDDSFKSLALKDLNKAGVDLSTVRPLPHARPALQLWSTKLERTQSSSQVAPIATRHPI